MHAATQQTVHCDTYPEYKVEDKHEIFEASVTAAERHLEACDSCRPTQIKLDGVNEE